jgi:DNA replication protein DnaC
MLCLKTSETDVSGHRRHASASPWAMIDRLVHHSEILSLKGDSYRLRDKDLGARGSAEAGEIA